jgi:hypothetical protein
LQSESNQSFENANFRHQAAAGANVEANVEPKETTSAYFRRRFSNDSFMDIPSAGSNIVRTVANIDPQKSGILLTYLDLKNIYRWMQDLVQLQKKHPHEVLNWGFFVATNIALRLNAYNEAKNIIPRVIIDGVTLNIPNEQLVELILSIALPRSEIEFIDAFKTLVKFRKLKNNAHEAIPDSSRYDVWYEGIIEYIYEANEVIDLLRSDSTRDFCPILKTYSNKPGLCQLFYDGIPMQTGKNIHDALRYVDIVACTNFRQYSILVQARNQKLMDDSDTQKQNRSQLCKRDSSNVDASKKDSTTLNRWPSRREPVDTGKNVSFNRYNNNNNAINNRQIVPYNNPHNNNRVNNLYNAIDENILDDYDFDDDDCNISYDLDEVFGQRPDFIEGENPFFNPTRILSSIDRNIDSLPCYAELQGKCLNKQTCKFSHDAKLLQKTWSEKWEELNRSRYRPAMGQLPKNNTPLTPLRSITTEEGGQVSTPTDNNSNEMNHHLDRNSTVSFADQQSRNTPELSKGGGDRGQRFL